MSAKKDMDVWAHFGEGGALSVDVVSRSEAEELSVRVAQLEDEVRPSARRDLPKSPGGSCARKRRTAIALPRPCRQFRGSGSLPEANQKIARGARS